MVLRGKDGAAIVCAATLAVTLAGCGGGDAGDSAEPAPTVTVTATATATETVVATPTEAPDETQDVGKLGRQFTTEWGTIAVLEFDPSVDTDPGSMNSLGYERWVGVLAQACVDESWDGEAIKLGWSPWSVAARDGSTFRFLDVTGPNYPQPIYPQTGNYTTRPGTCSKGWIVFPATNAVDISEVAYEGLGLKQPLVWTVKK